MVTWTVCILFYNNISLVFYREMLDRALVKRLKDSDSEEEEEEESSCSSLSTNSSTDKPTDILTIDKTADTQVGETE